MSWDYGVGDQVSEEYSAALGRASREAIVCSGTVQAAACPWCEYVWRLELLQGYTPRSEAPVQMCVADSFLGGHDADSLMWAREHGFQELKLMSAASPPAVPPMPW